MELRKFFVPADRSRSGFSSLSRLNFNINRLGEQIRHHVLKHSGFKFYYFNLTTTPVNVYIYIFFFSIQAIEKSVKTRQLTLFSVIDLLKGEWLLYELVSGMKLL